jgi:hypothetical protein
MPCAFMRKLLTVVCLRARERHRPRSGALEHRQLVPQGKYFKLKRGARMRQRSEGEEEREQYRHDRPAAYPSSAVTSTAATRTDFSVDTPVRRPAIHGRFNGELGSANIQSELEFASDFVSSEGPMESARRVVARFRMRKQVSRSIVWRTAVWLLVDIVRFASVGFRSRSQLVAENLFLRKQLALYTERQVRPRRADNATRITLVMLSKTSSLGRERRSACDSHGGRNIGETQPTSYRASPRPYPVSSRESVAITFKIKRRCCPNTQDSLQSDHIVLKL